VSIDPTVLWAAVASGAAFLAVLVKDYIANLKAERDAWKKVALSALSLAEQKHD
jgi:hypothetical protein